MIDTDLIDYRDAWEWIDSLDKERDRELVYKFTTEHEVMFGEWIVANYAEEIARYKLKNNIPEWEND